MDEVDLYGSNIILTARVPQHASQEADKLTLIFRAVTTEFTRLRDGIMSGFAGTERYLGAWKLAMIRPQWHMTEQLEALCDKAAIDDLNALYQACQTSGAVGILFSTSLRDADPSVQNRREAFHRIVSDDPDRDSPQPRKALGDLLTKDIRPSLEELVADAVEVLPDMSNLRSSEVTTIVTDVLLEKLNEVAELKWHLIQPAQIITFKEHTTPGERSTKDVLEDIETLLTTTNIEIAFAAAPSC